MLSSKQKKQKVFLLFFFELSILQTLFMKKL